MRDFGSDLDMDAEASHIAVQPIPGAVFLRLRRTREDDTVRRMFVELNLNEAHALHRELEACIEIAAAAARP